MDLDAQPIEAKDIQSLCNVLQQSVRVVVAESEVRGKFALGATGLDAAFRPQL